MWGGLYVRWWCLVGCYEFWWGMNGDGRLGVCLGGDEGRGWFGGVGMVVGCIGGLCGNMRGWGVGS